jgi:hypothetical protein
MPRCAVMGLSRPECAYFFRCVVAHRKNKAEMGCFGCRELIPGLAAIVCGTQPRLFELTEVVVRHNTPQGSQAELRCTSAYEQQVGPQHDLEAPDCGLTA